VKVKDGRKVYKGLSDMKLFESAEYVIQGRPSIDPLHCLLLSTAGAELKSLERKRCVCW
jgi:hypothetical protein